MDSPNSIVDVQLFFQAAADAEGDEVQGTEDNCDFIPVEGHGNTDGASVPDAGCSRCPGHLVVVLEDRATPEKANSSDNALEHPGLGISGIQHGESHQHETAADHCHQGKGPHAKVDHAFFPVQPYGESQDVRRKQMGQMGNYLQPVDIRQ